MSLSSSVREVILRRREQVEIYRTLDPKKTALVVIDMQNAFCEPGHITSVEAAPAIVPNINRIARSLRDAGGPVFWVQMKIKDEADWPVYLGDIVSKRDSVDQFLACLSPAGTGTGLWPELDVQEGDTVLEKNRFSAFLSRACRLMEHLERARIDTVIIAGTLTNVCCESSARDAAMHDYKVVFAADANAARTQRAHDNSLDMIAQCFGDVRDTAQIVALIESGSAR
jgi:ureidoacrylate peracid hydrolase